MSDSRVLSATAVMASGTILSRFSGYFRTLLIIAALGQALHADIFTIANTIPNAVYILVAGGVFNAVLVPQLVRSMKNDEDGGDAYAARIITLSAIFLAVVTVVLVLVAPLLMRVYLDGRYFDPTAPRTSTRRSRSPATACRRSSSTACSCCSARCSTPGRSSAR